jgi:hypothetical protein
VGELEAGRETVAIGSLHIGRLFAEIAGEVQPITAASVEITWRNELGPEPILADRTKLKGGRSRVSRRSLPGSA